MDNHKYVDSNGETILLVQTDIPGLTLVPDGKTRFDQVALSEAAGAQEHQKFVDKAAGYKEVDVKAELTKLQAKVDNQEQTIAAQADAINKLNKAKP